MRHPAPTAAGRGNADELRKHAGSFDFILDAVSADHDGRFRNGLERQDAPFRSRRCPSISTREVEWPSQVRRSPPGGGRA